MADNEKVKLQIMIDPQPTTETDPRMHMRLRDMPKVPPNDPKFVPFTPPKPKRQEE